ncbi:MAG: rhomboid family intramembrane serine protease, partial [Phycisphaerales bacterium JB063]
ADALPTLDDAVVVKWLLGINIAVYLLDQMLRVSLHTVYGTSTPGYFTYLGNFNIPQAMNQWELWRLFTYQFLHGNLFHLVMNMMALYVFGPMMATWWGTRRFIAFYLLCGACGAWLMAMLTYAGLLAPVAGPGGWLVGASGSIFGLLVGVAMVAPKLEVKLIFPPIWLTVRRLAFVFGLISLAGLLLDWNGGGNAAHLGGALFGYVLIKRPWTLDWADREAPKLEPPGEGADVDAS